MFWLKQIWRKYMTVVVQSSEVFFKIKLFYFWILWPNTYFLLMIKINNFWGDLSGISAKPATLVQRCLLTTWRRSWMWQRLWAPILKSTESSGRSLTRPSCWLNVWPKVHKYCWDTYILWILPMLEVSNSRGDLTNVSAETNVKKIYDRSGAEQWSFFQN